MIMTEKEISERIEALFNEKMAIQSQIDTAVANFHATGEYADPSWMARAKAALKYKSREHQEMMRKLGEEKRKKRKMHHDTMDKVFIELVKEHIDKDLFYVLMQEAKAEADFRLSEVED